MDRRTAITTARTAARRVGSLGSRVVLRVGHEVRGRVAARRVSQPRTAPPAAPLRQQEPAPPTMEPAAPQRRTPTPADVALAVQRNAAGLVRANPVTRKAPRRRSGPGAKLPARAGQGIVGV